MPSGSSFATKAPGLVPPAHGNRGSGGPGRIAAVHGDLREAPEVVAPQEPGSALEAHQAGGRLGRRSDLLAKLRDQIAVAAAQLSGKLADRQAAAGLPQPAPRPRRIRPGGRACATRPAMYASRIANRATQPGAPASRCTSPRTRPSTSSSETTKRAESWCIATPNSMCAPTADRLRRAADPQRRTEANDDRRSVLRHLAPARRTRSLVHVAAVPMHDPCQHRVRASLHAVVTRP